MDRVSPARVLDTTLLAPAWGASPVFQELKPAAWGVDRKIGMFGVSCQDVGVMRGVPRPCTKTSDSKGEHTGTKTEKGE